MHGSAHYVRVTLPHDRSRKIPATNRVFSKNRLRTRNSSDSPSTHIPQSVSALDHDWRITYANAEARRISHITDDDINTRTYWDLFPETIGTEVERKYRHVMQTRGPAHVEFYHAPFKIWLEVHIYPTLTVWSSPSTTRDVS